jgi:hypothetical protein
MLKAGRCNHEGLGGLTQIWEEADEDSDEPERSSKLMNITFNISWSFFKALFVFFCNFPCFLNQLLPCNIKSYVARFELDLRLIKLIRLN